VRPGDLLRARSDLEGSPVTLTTLWDDEARRAWGNEEHRFSRDDTFLMVGTFRSGVWLVLLNGATLFYADTVWLKGNLRPIA
jgi:hypothetical protein